MPEKFKPFVSSDRFIDVSMDISQIVDEATVSKPSVSLKKANLSMTNTTLH